MSRYKILVLVGSLRRNSYNRKLAGAVAKLAPPDFDFAEAHIADLPLYNQDDDAAQTEAVKRLKSEIAAASGVALRHARIQPLHPRSAQERD